MTLLAKYCLINAGTGWITSSYPMHLTGESFQTSAVANGIKWICGRKEVHQVGHLNIVIYSMVRPYFVGIFPYMGFHRPYIW